MVERGDDRRKVPIVYFISFLDFLYSGPKVKIGFDVNNKINTLFSVS